MRTFSKIVFAVIAGAALTAGQANAADAAKGKKEFRKCVACHSVKKGAKHRSGPNLFGVVGRVSGTAAGFTRYSQAMKDAKLTWDEATLDIYIKKPRQLIKKTRMSFAGIKQANRRANLIAYLKELKD